MNALMKSKMRAIVKASVRKGEGGRVKLALIYVVTALLSLMVFIISFFPAAPVWKYVGQDPLAKIAPTVRFVRISGTVWAGSAIAIVDNPNLLPMELNWKLQDISLINPGMTYWLSLKGDQLQLDANLTANRDQMVISNMTSSIEALKVSDLTRHYGFEAEGVFYMKPTELLIKNNKIQDISGFLGWTGGLLSFTTGSTSISRTFSEAGGNLMMVDGIASITFLERGKPLLSAELGADGWLRLNADATVVAGENQPMAGQSGRGFTYEEKLW